MSRLIICKNCGKLKPILAKNMCSKCYHKMLWKNLKNSYIKHKIGNETIKLIIDKKILTSRDATKYIKFKQQQILAEAIKNPKKYLED